MDSKKSQAPGFSRTCAPTRPMKKARFGEDDDAPRQFATVAIESPHSQCTVLPDTDAMEEEDERLYVADDCRPMRDVNPELAAKRRAARRQEAASAAAATAISVAVPLDIPEDIADAEEDDPSEATGFNEAGLPVPLEPFNLEREREEGYFDADGSYVEYRLDDMTDAWLEGLGQQEQALRIDNVDAAQLLRQALAASDPTQEQAERLDAEDRALYKGRIVNMLQPGETVLQALRRLANMNKQQLRQQQLQDQAAAIAGQHGLESHSRGRRSRRGGSEWDLVPVAGADCVDDDDDDDPSAADNAFTLQQQGRSGERQRLKKLRQQQQQPGLAEGSASAAPHSNNLLVQHATGQAQTSVSAAAAPALPVDAAAAAVQRTERDAGHAAGQPAQRSPGMQRMGPHRRVPAENSIEFDKLTEYADMLLGQSEFDIYTKSREELEREASAAVAEAGGSLGSAHTAQPTAAAEAAAVSGQQQARTAAAFLDIPPLDPCPPAAASIESLREGQRQEHPQAAASVSAAGDDSMDIFGEEFDVEQVRHLAASAAGPSGIEQTLGMEGRPVPAVSFGGQVDDQGAPTALSPADGREPSAMEQGVGGLPAGPEEAPLAGQQGEAGEDLQGFELDPDSGMYYNSALGFFYDPVSQRWRDAASGDWFKMEAGQYVKL